MAHAVMTNPEFELAEQFVLHTRKHCFITGKAGTGKTTLLKGVASATQKSVVVVAPQALPRSMPVGLPFIRCSGCL